MPSRATTAPLRRDQDIGSSRLPAAPSERHGAIGADGDHGPLAALLQAAQEVGVVAGVGVGGHAGAAHAPGLGPVQEVQGDLRLGPEGEIRGLLGLLAAVGVVGPVLGSSSTP
jgi:hypothetical protein